jgi:hypothetical protein
MNSFFEIYSNAAEYANSLPDEFGRSRIYNTKNPDVFSPILSKKIFDGGFQPHYPENKNFAVCISHDIDHLYLNQRVGRKLVNATKGIIRGKYELSNYYVKSLVRPQIYDQYNLDKLIALDGSYGIRSSYFFLALDQHEQDHNYRIEKIQGQIAMVIGKKCEVGLHGGHQAFNNLDKLVAEKNKLQNSLGIQIDGYRSHYLRFDLPATWNNLSQAGFLYDTTLGYADCVGFRNGMCYPHYPFDVNNNRFLNIIELPLIVMDATIFYYMRLNVDRALKACMDLIEKVKQCRGVFTLLWHNNFLEGDMGGFYRKLLGLLQQEDPWFATSRELVNWWKEEHLLQQSHAIISNLIAGENSSVQGSDQKNNF